MQASVYMREGSGGPSTFSRYDSVAGAAQDRVFRSLLAEPRGNA